MVVKTDICSFSEYKIYPGRGQRYFAKDGRGFFFLTKKAKSLSFRKVKAQKITWTVARRRLFKKVKSTDISLRKKKKAVVTQRSIVGISLEELNKRKNQDAQVKKAEAEKYLRDYKQKKQQQIDKKRSDRKLQGKDTKIAKKQDAKKVKNPKQAKKQ
ncbi:hypothetical protein IMG5_139680 [Ichthyophthirius multifiliis]|uniref:Large ribosomal subunit protein eL24-related N-terminal domain-containing protein n=1 Tax=Ichthyophthirius multifiliis TaxID=5932 RepID=G0QX93_ICHMU|nr:hypothetical protein IMG5_139680 [Ichthyophthirius multifiliis]EGR30165.1 hypothetical protein IMG5_139680 [Ichthyophthirius multifiliis]|eukprot:XP_004031401.1 hypothetical protein IMG5_139680 [Ichthyophthirius multifiliis]